MEIYIKTDLFYFKEYMASCDLPDRIACIDASCALFQWNVGVSYGRALDICQNNQLISLSGPVGY